MSWTRTGVFITLTLVATTLPASARPSALTPEKRPDATTDHGLPADASCPKHSPDADTAKTSQPASKSTPKPDRPEQKNAPDAGLLLQAACQMDVWKSAPTRPLGNAGPQLPAGAIHGLPTAWRPCLAIGRHLQSHAASVNEHAREWAICRYPNAPPISA